MSTQINEHAARTRAAVIVDQKLEVVVIPVTDDGNSSLPQELNTRLPGRGFSSDVATMTELLRETEERHGNYKPTAPKHHWSDWYAAYIVARERGRTPDEAAADAALNVERECRS